MNFIVFLGNRLFNRIEITRQEKSDSSTDQSTRFFFLFLLCAHAPLKKKRPNDDAIVFRVDWPPTNVTSIRRHQMFADCLLATKSYRRPTACQTVHAVTQLRGKHRLTEAGRRRRNSYRIVEQRRDGRACSDIACRPPYIRCSSDGIQSAAPQRQSLQTKADDATPRRAATGALLHR